MTKIGLVAGSGSLPLEFVRFAKERGEKVVVFALEGIASRELDGLADKVHWLNLDQYKKFMFLLLTERIRRLAFVGKVEKSVIYNVDNYGREVSEGFKGLRDKKDTSIFEGIKKHLGKVGIEVVEVTRYLSRLLPEKGVLSGTLPDSGVEEDISFGYDMAKKIAGMDIGQTVVVKGKSIVAVEAMEGTDATISRAGEVAGDGCVMIKVGRPNQDMRWDVPTVGPDTIAKLAESRFSALAIESGKMFLVEKEKMLKMADEAKITIKVL
ncbi:MAG: UDP-2,3-diacylglucosamine diphosphatase LpxI [Candidatus Omnitrophota bacterium]|jgi:DUF1009 family protein